MTDTSTTYVTLKDKDTKNKVRYFHPDLGTIYVPKSAAEKLGNPQQLKVTFSAAE